MELVATPRTIFGKAVQTLRRQGLIPGELYGHGIENVHVTIPAKEFKKVFKSAGESSMIYVVIGSEKRPAVIHEVYRDSITDEVMSVDFYQVRLDEAVKVEVPLEFVGESPAVKNLGGLLVKAVNALEVEALPADIPRSITVDIGVLTEIGKSIQVSELSISPNIKLFANPKTVVATVTAKMTEEEEQALAAEGAKVEDIKVETEEKKAERLAKQAEGATPEGAAGAAEAPAKKKE
jgi:large subunit ribosomal protein L25